MSLFWQVCPLTAQNCVPPSPQALPPQASVTAELLVVGVDDSALEALDATDEDMLLRDDVVDDVEIVDDTLDEDVLPGNDDWEDELREEELLDEGLFDEDDLLLDELLVGRMQAAALGAGMVQQRA